VIRYSTGLVLPGVTYGNPETHEVAETIFCEGARGHLECLRDLVRREMVRQPYRLQCYELRLLQFQFNLSACTTNSLDFEDLRST